LHQASGPKRALVTDLAADAELEWFFAVAESRMGKRSNFLDSLVPARHREDSLDARLTASRAYRIIEARLQAIGDPHAGVLECAYASARTPLLSSCFGPLAGVAVRLAAAAEGLPDDGDALARLERAIGARLGATIEKLGAPALADLARRAEVKFRAAFGAYCRRRRGPSAVEGLS
jgi:hypothetical protein